MGVRSWLADLAVSSPRVLLVEAPGWGGARVRLEGALRRRGWSLALSPADADVLLLVGAPGDRLAEVVERVWDQMPGPRARGTTTTGADGPALDAVLDAAAGVLRDEYHQLTDAAARSSWSGGGTDVGTDVVDDASDDADAGGADHGGADHGDMDHGDMDMGDMDMEMSPDGIALAGGDGSDRDGLEMDVLHVPLGPVLPSWPAGLVVRATLSGDVVTAADVEVLPAGAPPLPPDDRTGGLLAAALLADRAARLLTLAGAHGPSAELERWRDEVVDRPPGALGDLDEALERIERHVRRSRVLRWSLRGLGTLDAAALAEHGLPASAEGDVHDRLLAMLADARAVLLVPASSGAAGICPNGIGADPRCAEPVGGDGPGDEAPRAPWPVAAARAALPTLITGYELAAVRLVVASLPLDPTAVDLRAEPGAPGAPEGPVDRRARPVGAR